MPFIEPRLRQRFPLAVEGKANIFPFPAVGDLNDQRAAGLEYTAKLPQRDGIAVIGDVFDDADGIDKIKRVIGEGQTTGILVFDEIVREANGVGDSLPPREDPFVVEIGGMNFLRGSGCEEDTGKLGAAHVQDSGIVQTQEFLAAIDLDPKFDFAGPHRSLGLLYLDAPGWPASIGNRTKARLHLRKAVELSPDYPDNWLSLLEGYLKWSEKSIVQAQLASTEEMLQRARKNLTGEKWELSWHDWERRWAKIKAKASESASSLESPRQRK